MAVVTQDGVVVLVVGILLADDAVTFLAGVVVPVVAALAKMSGIFIALIIVGPQPFPAPAADDGAVL